MQNTTFACNAQIPPFYILSDPLCTDVMRSPKLKAIPWVFERIRMYPASLPSLSSFFSTETLTKASSPNTLVKHDIRKEQQQQQKNKARNIGDEKSWLSISQKLMNVSLVWYRNQVGVISEEIARFWSSKGWAIIDKQRLVGVETITGNLSQF